MAFGLSAVGTSKPAGQRSVSDFYDEDELRGAVGKCPLWVLRAVEEDRCEAVILGCAGMSDLTAWLSEQSGVPVIDGVVAGVKLVEALVGAGLFTSKIGAYGIPRVK